MRKVSLFDTFRKRFLVSSLKLLYICSMKLKLRAWVKSDKNMIDLDSIHFDGYGGFEVSGCGYEALDHFEVVLMHDTGMVDCNGKEIFEGDVLRWYSSNPFSKGKMNTVEVEYKEANFWCKGRYIQVYLGELLSLERCEVIGNVYETIDL